MKVNEQNNPKNNQKTTYRGIANTLIMIMCFFLIGNYSYAGNTNARDSVSVIPTKTGTAIIDIKFVEPGNLSIEINNTTGQKLVEMHESNVKNKQYVLAKPNHDCKDYVINVLKDQYLIRSEHISFSY